MKILLIHQNFPGQYKHIAAALVARGDEVTALCIETNPVPAGVRVIRYGPKRGNTPNIHAWVQETETKVIRGEACFKAAKRLREHGYHPDLICAHPGWGEALFIKEVWPQIPLLNYFEFYYRVHGADVGFDPEFPDDPDEAPRLLAKNFANLMNLEQCDAGVSPTAWQKSTHPASFQHKIRVIHEGLDTAAIAPKTDTQITLQGKARTLRAGDEVITFVNRNLEPYRGCHSFIRAIPEIQRRRPKAHILIVGGDGVSYGSRPVQGTTYREQFLEEVRGDIDFRRLDFVGTIPYPVFIGLLQISAVHVYLTYPFVLSWSMLEAMSAGCLVLGSRTPPVEEVITHGENGLLVDFFSPQQIAEQVAQALEFPGDFTRLRQRARQTIIDRYDLQRICLPQHLAYIDELAGRSLKD
ncbi:MAG: D-inositol 3-phosphate glycosyltransferase [Candidatus Accumulibacter phosphatis]|uniref:D-inositol 3-phosphate glycosyltransferase n=1 Tax=Candidatus Accumulibacter phosphatis TaxID=327160 RepID=A0A080LTA1_9PROT|nr:glycosyltransferase family 4 protein [Accumulibacter sp.]KFB70815.1 MAG: D-inositol 3-phosphate glycosyltransferase [Candidatus Accumulibacter phosphatis]MBL8407078.1 glycosyltransferase family 4 protein [Accumulibacter sp.]